MATPGRPLHLTTRNMGLELYARGFVSERDDAMVLAETQPNVAWDMLRQYHDLDTATEQEWGKGGVGTDLPRPGAP